MDRQSWHLYQRKADVIAAAGHPLRLAILDILTDGELCVCDICRQVAAKRSCVSRHLGVLLTAGIIRQRKDGLKMMYSLRTRCVLNFMECVEGVLREQAQEAHAMLASL